MSESQRGGDLFIVDNSDEGWSGLRYLNDWTDLATRFDIATGYFEIGALLEMDGKWQQLEKIRILMGDETTVRTKQALSKAIKEKANLLDKSIEADKDKNPFLKGVDSIVEAIKSGQIECRVYKKDKFHAKAYITHAKTEVIGAVALVGSSNFTRPGLTDNIELNIRIQPAAEVRQLQDWFERHWEDAEPVSEQIIKVIERHVRPYTPFDVYAKALQEFFKGHEMTAGEWEESKSQMFNILDRYQREAYWALMKIANRYGGAFLCDGVGLGKTFVGLMLIERLVLHEGKRVVLFAPKGAKEGVWEPHLNDWLPHIGGGADFSNLAVFAHTDLNREGEFPERFKRIAELADVVIIDEAHHFRNPGKQGEGEDQEGRSRYYRLFDLLDPELRSKTMFMLTATPINNALSDFRHMAELFTRKDETYFAKTLGINNLRAHFNNLEKKLRSDLGVKEGDFSEQTVEATQMMARENLFQELVVQRSRAYARESQMRENKGTASFPERKPPQVAEYSIRKTYGGLLDMIEDAFQKKDPLFSLPIYYPLNYYKGDKADIEAFTEGRQQQVVRLIRTQFLKRFESSVKAFEVSCDRLMRKLMAFVEKNTESEHEAMIFEKWKRQNHDVIDYVYHQQLDMWGTPSEESEAEEDVVSPELLEAAEKLPREEYKVEDILAETYVDLNELVKFIQETRKFKPGQDDKLKKLIRLLKTKDLSEKKVLVFTEFADTARYLERELKSAGIEGLARIDGGTKGNRADIIKRFSPYYNRSSGPDLQDAGLEEIRVLISTDVLSEGLNLQDATRLINYDIHWNPVRLMQRIGRVDRRLSPDVEARMISDRPELAKERGKVLYYNFLPPEELNGIFRLYELVTQKTLRISKTLGIEGKKLLRPDDDYEALREFNQAYEGQKSAVEEMHLEYQALVDEDPDLEGVLASFPSAVFSGRKRVKRGYRGAFFCYSLPALDKEQDEFTQEAGTVRWYLCDLDSDKILEEPGDIVESIRAMANTPRRVDLDEKTLEEMRNKVLKHIKNTYLKRIDAPVGVRPELKCWMELNGE